MITRDEIIEFCKKHKIREPWFNPNDPNDTCAYISMSDIDYFKKFYKRRPSDWWIYLETDDDKKSQEDTKFYDPKLKHYYVSDIANKYEEYEFKAPCYMKFVLPFSTYKEHKIIELFNHILKHGDTKSNPVFGEFEYEYAPFSTKDELEYLYDKSIKNIEDNLAYLSDPTFIQTINKYKENTEHANELIKANDLLRVKACSILLKKAVISNEFEEK